MDDNFIKDRAEDLTWLCSLSESEIDMLISLKLLILHRAKMMGHEELAKKFDLKMLRAIALVLMEYLKARLEDSSHVPDVAKSAAFLDSCNLMNCDHGSFMSIEDLSKNIGVDLLKFVRSPLAAVGSKRRKQKVENRES